MAPCAGRKDALKVNHMSDGRHGSACEAGRPPDPSSIHGQPTWLRARSGKGTQSRNSLRNRTSPQREEPHRDRTPASPDLLQRGAAWAAPGRFRTADLPDRRACAAARFQTGSGKARPPASRRNKTRRNAAAPPLPRSLRIKRPSPLTNRRSNPACRNTSKLLPLSSCLKYPAGRSGGVQNPSGGRQQRAPSPAATTTRPADAESAPPAPA